jgi:uncharacterized RDD family membrane protein YckC
MGARMAAVTIDGLVLVVPVLAVNYALSFVFPDHGFGFFQAEFGGSASSFYTLAPPGWLVTLALYLGYFFVGEVLFGQTLGKRAMGLRVRAASGGPAGVNAISARTVLRLVDGTGGTYLVGALVALLSGSRRRRLGDWVGGTVVVHDDGFLEDEPVRAAWIVSLYPAAWLGAVLIAIFALGVGDAAGAGKRAVSLVRSYAKAREQGNAPLACSELASEQQRELVARQSGDYQTASAADCPRYILTTDPSTNLLNAAMAPVAAGPLETAYSPLGVVLVHSSRYPNMLLVAVRENGQLKLDIRGLEKVGFTSNCTAARRLTSAECVCDFNLLRAQGLLDNQGSDPGVLTEDKARCVSNPAAVQG